MNNSFIDLTIKDIIHQKYTIEQLEYSIKHNKIDLLTIIRYQELDYDFILKHYLFNVNFDEKKFTLPEIIYLQPKLNLKKLQSLQNEYNVKFY
jgi:hypothetical protein